MKKKQLLVPLIVAFVLAHPVSGADLDEDGLDDAVEQMLIDRHRPRLIFEDDERHWPISAERFVRSSRLRWNTNPDRTFAGNGWFDTAFSIAQLSTDPRLILRGGEARPDEPSNTYEHPSHNEWYLDLDDGLLGGVHPQPDGSAHEGMYGHAVPLNDGRIHLQYWQLFPHNEAECVSDCGDHEGDWLWIDLFLDGTPPYTLRQIVYHHHGDSNCPPTILPFPGEILPAPLPPRPPIPLPSDGVPVCYVEEQAHEWWPLASGGGECQFDPSGFDLCPNASHHGNGISYRVPQVENIGERYAPMPGSLAAELILLYNGRWGGWGSECFDHHFEPPDSPVHQSYPEPVRLSRVYVDRSRIFTEPGLGSSFRPFNRLQTAADKLLAGGVMSVRPDSYPEPVTLSTPMTIEAWR